MEARVVAHILCLFACCFGLAVPLGGDFKSYIPRENLPVKRLSRQRDALQYESDSGRLNERGRPGSTVFDSDLEKYNGPDRYEQDDCIDGTVKLYRHFNEVVNDVTRGTRVEKTGGEVCGCTSKDFILCNCSNSGLTHIPQGLNPNVSGLDLSGNFIPSLGAAVFQRYPKLKYLSLENNAIYKLSSRSFQGLSQLRVLDMRRNKLAMVNGTYPYGVFRDLPSLIALRINNNTKDAKRPGLDYPDESLAELTALKFLSMDGIKDKIFGEGFSYLKNLETLSLSGYLDGVCKLNSLTNETFRHLSQLKMLNVSDCFLEEKSIGLYSLQHLTNIHVIDFTWNEDMSVARLGDMLRPLSESGMKELYMRRVEWRFSRGIQIRKVYAESLPRNLTCLVISGNSINVLDHGVLGSLPKSLRYIDFSGNQLTFGSYLKDLHKLTSLEILQLNGAEYTFEIPKNYPYESKGSNFEPYRGGPNSLKLLGRNRRKEKNKFQLTLPPKLRVLKMEFAGLDYYLTELNVTEDNSLEELFLGNNFFPTIVGPFRGLNKLKKLVMTSCRIEEIKDNFFDNFPSLEHLDLYGNLIGTGNTLYRRPFSNLSKLRHLNLAFNVILSLRSDTFDGLSQLRELRLENNTYYKFNADISNMSYLTVLDLRTSSVKLIPGKTREKINSLKNIKVLLAGAPLGCNCNADAAEFLDWMSRDENDVIPKDSRYICVLRNGASKELYWKQFLSEVDILKRECAKNRGVFGIVLGVTILLLVLVIGSVMYRFRWRIRYLYYGVHGWLARGDAEKEENSFSFDVFISYSNEDLNFVLRTVCPELHKRNLTTHIHSRDFRVGDNVISNIIRAVKNSKRTLVVLTNNFIASKWCRAEFQMAKEESVVTGRQTLVFLIAEKIPKSKIGLELLTHIQQNTYIPYDGAVDNSQSVPDGGEERTCSRLETAMWDKLARDINA